MAASPTVTRTACAAARAQAATARPARARRAAAAAAAAVVRWALSASASARGRPCIPAGGRCRDATSIRQRRGMRASACVDCGACVGRSGCACVPVCLCACVPVCAVCVRGLCVRSSGCDEHRPPCPPSPPPRRDAPVLLSRCRHLCDRPFGLRFYSPVIKPSPAMGWELEMQARATPLPARFDVRGRALGFARACWGSTSPALARCVCVAAFVNASAGVRACVRA
jgi:hypothetical protein